jgi:hypothetical protein
LLDATKGLAAALALLTGLGHLSIRSECRIPQEVLPRLQQLTYLELASFNVKIHPLKGPGQLVTALQSIQHVTRLVDLRLAPIVRIVINSETLSSMQYLTRLALSGCAALGPGSLDAHTQLQHLQVPSRRDSPPCAADAAQLLSELQQLKYLTHLDLAGSLRGIAQGNPTASAFAALTASSKLRHLDISGCTLTPAGAP